MTTDDAFLSDIIENVEDDSPRLIYADWLDDQGQHDRADFIRIQCELARPPDQEARRLELKIRERKLLANHEGKWVGPLRKWLSAWEFQRGFVQGITLKAHTLLERADTLFRLAPLRHAEIHRIGKFGQALAACPHLARLFSLRIRQLSATDVADFLGSPHLESLTALDLEGNGIGDAGVIALTTSPHLPRLSVLDLARNSIQDQGAEALAESPHFARLHSLNLVRNHIGDAGAGALATSPHLDNLQALSLSGCWIGAARKQLLRTRFGDRVKFHTFGE